MRRIITNALALIVGLFIGATVTFAYADSAPCDCIKPIVRQPNGLPK